MSPTDLASRTRWVNYYKAKDDMFFHTDTKHSPWHVVHSDCKRALRLNCISHLLSMIPHKDLTPEPIVMPEGQKDVGYIRLPEEEQTHVPENF